MSEVNADGVLIDPQEALLQEAQHLTHSPLAQRPTGLGEERAERTIAGGNGAPAGTVGGAPHAPTKHIKKKGKGAVVKTQARISYPMSQTE